MTDRTLDLSDLERRATAAKQVFGEHAHIVCDNLVRIYKTEGVEVVALQGLDLLVDQGELIALVGASGSGKSTLLNILSGLDIPTAGTARVAGSDLLTMTSHERVRYRREVVGFVWQQTARNLLPYLTAAENVELPMRFTGVPKADREDRMEELLELMGVDNCAERRPAELSGGEQQRVAIARAFVNRPMILIADEPTGNLDPATSVGIMKLLDRINRADTTVLMATHDSTIVDQMRKRVIELDDGEVVRDQSRGVYGYQ